MRPRRRPPAERPAADRELSAAEREAHAIDERIRPAAPVTAIAIGGRASGPAPARACYSPGMVGTASRSTPVADADLDREIEIIGRALIDRGPIRREELARAVGARYWGPGRFPRALREALQEGRALRVARRTYAPPPDSGGG